VFKTLFSLDSLVNGWGSVSSVIHIYTEKSPMPVFVLLRDWSQKFVPNQASQNLWELA
jgi:hypothetical protein